jgi:hypothetical protein
MLNPGSRLENRTMGVRLRHLKTALSVLSAASIVLSASHSPVAKAAEQSGDEPAKLHSWRRIVYPDLPCPWATKTVRPTIYPLTEGDSPGLQLNLTFRMHGEFSGEREKWVEPDGRQIDVRLHYSDETVVQRVRNKDSDLDPLDDIVVFAGGSLGVSGDLRRKFPWGENKLREAWIELEFPGMTYWLGIPYGFTRNPAEPLCAAEKAGDPKFAPAMSALKKDAKIVNWQYVEYRLDPPQENWGLTLRQSNPFNAACVVVLYMGSTDPGDLHTSRTAVRIEQPERPALTGSCWKIEAIEGNRDGNRHDSFKFNTNGGSGQNRCWGGVVVNVGDKEARAIVPSSLFNYVHGVADPYHKANFR